jgi:uncharacterized protein YndB with AHSA1/START domain
MEKIRIQSTLSVDKQKAWEYYTKPEHITNWNFADPSWHCPSASNDLKIGGRYIARMEAKDGSFGFEFDAIYIVIHKYENFIYEFDGRQATVEFKDVSGQTEVTISFDPETENPIDLQRQGWQAILDNFKKYTETN